MVKANNRIPGLLDFIMEPDRHLEYHQCYSIEDRFRSIEDQTHLLLCCGRVWNGHNALDLLLNFVSADLTVHVLLLLVLGQGQLLLHVLHALHVARHGVLGVELDEADLAVEGLLLPLLLLVGCSRVRLPQGEARWQAKRLHGGQRIIVVLKSVNHRRIADLESKKPYCIDLILYILYQLDCCI